ncbi:30S ribosomal protein S13 [archaeon HR06]|nr:30S ribosomal protein S13 [archaeon HR06]
MSTEFKYIVRIAGRDLDGSKKLAAALADIKGVGWNLAHAIINYLKLDPKLRLGFLTEEQINLLENAIKDLTKLKLPSWYFNRRKDLESGVDTHLVGNELEFSVKMDIEREKLMNSWRGVRHSLGLKVRGQRTRTTGRKGKTVGVRKGAK